MLLPPFIVYQGSIIFYSLLVGSIQPLYSLLRLQYSNIHLHQRSLQDLFPFGAELWQGEGEEGDYSLCNRAKVLEQSLDIHCQGLHIHLQLHLLFNQLATPLSGTLDKPAGAMPQQEGLY